MSDIKAFFEEKLPAKFAADPDRAEGMQGVYQFEVSGEGGGAWGVAVDAGKLTVTPGGAAEPGCTIKIAAEDWSAILSGELEPTTAFMTGKLLVEGDMSMAMKLQPILSEL